MSWSYSNRGQEVNGHLGTDGSIHVFHGLTVTIGGGGQGGGGRLWLSGSTQKAGVNGTARTNPGGGGGGAAAYGSASAGQAGGIWLFYNHGGG